MLVLRKYKQDESEEIKRLLMVEEINDLDLNPVVYIAMEDDSVIGVCKIKIEDQNGLLKYLVIKENNRGQNLGDGLLRSILNKLDNQGIEKVYFDGINPYLLKKGFSKNNENKLELNIAEFFTIGCKCSGKSNEI